MRFFARHGVFEQERTVGNWFTVSLKIKTDCLKACQTDNLKHTLNYAAVYEIVATEMAQPSHLLEHVAGRIVKTLRNYSKQLTEIDLKLSKLNPPLNGEIEKASVRLVWKNEE
jgi:dihydroneopterin aldolase